MIFIDTSAFYALLDADDSDHSKAVGYWNTGPPGEGGLVTSNYVVLETQALLQVRLGMTAVRAFNDAVLPLARVEWIDRDLDRAATAAFLAADRRGLSLVDLSSFEVMRRLGVRSAFTFDRHFRQFGFETVPDSPDSARHG